MPDKDDDPCDDWSQTQLPKKNNKDDISGEDV